MNSMYSLESQLQVQSIPSSPEQRAAKRDKERQALRGFLSEKKRLLSETVESSSASSLALLNSNINSIGTNNYNNSNFGKSLVVPNNTSGHASDTSGHASDTSNKSNKSLNELRSGNNSSRGSIRKSGEFGLGITKVNNIGNESWNSPNSSPSNRPKSRWSGSQDIAILNTRTPPQIPLPSAPSALRDPYLPPISAKPLPLTPPEIATMSRSPSIHDGYKLTRSLSSKSNKLTPSPSPIPRSPSHVSHHIGSNWTSSPLLIPQPNISSSSSSNPIPSPTIVFNPFTPPLLPLPSLPSISSLSLLASPSIISPSSSLTYSNRDLFPKSKGNGSISSYKSQTESSDKESRGRGGGELNYSSENDSDNSDRGTGHVDFSVLLSSPLPKRRYSKRPSVPLSPPNSSTFSRSHSFSGTKSRRRSSSPSTKSTRAPSDSTIISSEEGSISIFDSINSREGEEEDESAESEIDVDASLETLAWRTGVMGRAGKDVIDDEDDEEAEERRDEQYTLSNSRNRSVSRKSGAGLSIDVEKSEGYRRSSSSTNLASSTSSTNTITNKKRFPTSPSVPSLPTFAQTPRNTIPGSNSSSPSNMTTTRRNNSVPTIKSNSIPPSLSRSNSITSTTSSSNSNSNSGTKASFSSLIKSKPSDPWKPIIVTLPNHTPSSSPIRRTSANSINSNSSSNNSYYDPLSPTPPLGSSLIRSGSVVTLSKIPIAGSKLPVMGGRRTSGLPQPIRRTGA